MRVFRTSWACAIVLALLVLASGIANAEIWDLSADWSDTINPNGVWSYYVIGELGTSGTRGSDSFAAPGPPPIWTVAGYPDWLGWSQSNGSESGFGGDLEIGDIYGHTPYANWGSGTLEIRWTSPLAGPIDISGGAWAPRDIARWNAWQLTLNGSSVLSSGYTYSGDPYSRATPNMIDVVDLIVGVGDIVAFSAQMYPAGDPWPDYIAVDLAITSDTDLTTVPVPGAALLGVLGLSYTGLRLRRKRG